MTRAMLMYRKRLETDTGHIRFLEYYLLTDEIFFASNVLEVYGAEVRVLGPGGAALESRRIRAITPFGPRITALISAMAQGMVTPASMGEVVEELILST